MNKSLYKYFDKSKSANLLDDDVYIKEKKLFQLLMEDINNNIQLNSFFVMNFMYSYVNLAI